ncbi:two pore calcium channel protein 1-like isoform X5 [Branchiostoma floridae]|uniref:Two pore calcium channel protein 1-like isoform X5 n=1 Tax=Branchiostoma floridae TaxID=7739 RepID=A0A9J7LAA6_BRAFL|nr:two pore calcium channel protein 1-like isoform X5 [Branchiostoma floridae]
MEEDVEKRTATNGGFVGMKFSVESEERTGGRLSTGRRSPDSPMYDTSPKAKLLENTGDVNKNGRGQNGNAVREPSDRIPMHDRTISRSSGSLKEEVKTWAKPRSDKKTESKETKKETLRPLNRRSSLENFGRFGLLAPAVALAPAIHGSDELTKTFVDLQGENRELKLAAAHIDDALAGRGKYGKARAIFKPKFAQRCFYIISNRWFKRFLYLVILLHCTLTFWEPPQEHITAGSMNWWVYIGTSFCLLCYYVDIALHMAFMTWRVYWALDENKWMRVEFYLVCMFTFDFIMLIIQEAISMRLAQPFRCLRAGMLLCKAKNVGHIFDVLLSIIIKLGKVFVIILVFILTFSAIGVHIFMEAYHDNCTTNSATTVITCTDNDPDVYTGVFDQIGTSSLQLFVLLSTENYPDFMMKAFDKERAAFLYFGIFLYVGVYFLAAILLAIIVDSYWEFSKKHVKRERSRERAELGKAWNLLDPLGEGQLAVNDERLLTLFRILKPKNTDEENRELITEIDQDSDGFVDAFDWTTGLNDALSFEFEESDVQEITRVHGTCFSFVIDVFKRVAQATVFSIFILVLIGIHCILFCVRWHSMTRDDELIVQAIRSAIVFLFLVEITIRFIGLGRKMLDPLELADMLMVVIAIVGNVVWYVVVYVIESDVLVYRGWCIVVSSLAVFTRLGFNSSQTKKAFVLFMKIYPVMFDLLLLVFIIIYMYSTLGMEIFFRQDPTSINTEYETSLWDYKCGLGFQTFFCSLAVVFQVVTTSNWHEIMNAAILNTSHVALIYFVTCYIVVNLVVMNLFVAIAIEAFNKLGKNDDDDIGQLQKEKTTFADTAKNFLNAVFESTRSQNKLEDGLPKPNLEVLRKPSLRPTTAPPEDSDEDKDEDLSGLTKEERMQRRMKNRKRNKRKQAMLGKLRAIQAFQANGSNELDLKVGDEVDALEKKGDWYKGRKHDKVGWFPVTHVESLGRQSSLESGKSLEEAPKQPATRPKSGAVPVEPAPPPAPKVETPRNSVTTLTPRNSLSEPPRLSVDHGSMLDRPRLKKKKSTSEWRRSILGDMTVMNPEEMKELNKIVKGGIRMSSRRNRNSIGRKTTVSSMSSDDGIQEEPEEEDEEENPMFLSTYPSINTTSSQMNPGKSGSPPTTPARKLTPQVSLQAPQVKRLKSMFLYFMVTERKVPCKFVTFNSM